MTRTLPELSESQSLRETRARSSAGRKDGPGTYRVPLPSPKYRAKSLAGWTIQGRRLSGMVQTLPLPGPALGRLNTKAFGAQGRPNDLIRLRFLPLPHHPGIPDGVGGAHQQSNVDQAHQQGIGASKS